MAREPIPEDVIKIREDAAAYITQLVDKEEVHTFDGLPELTVELADGSFRKKPAIGGMEVFFQRVRVGKRGDPIAVFVPVVAQDYVAIEFKPKDLDSALPLFTPELILEIIQAKGSTKLFPDENFATVFEMVVKALTEQRAEEEAIGTKEISQHPLFGMV